MLQLTLLSLVLLPASWAQIPRYNTPFACYLANGGTTGSPPSGAGTRSTTDPAFTGSRSACQAYCINNPLDPASPFYFANSYTPAGGVSTCVCSTQSPPFNQLNNGLANYECNPADLHSSFLQTTFQNVGCILSNTNLVGLTETGPAVSDSRQCLVRCSGSPNVAVKRSTAAGATTSYGCFCGTLQGTYTTPNICQAYNFRIFSHSAEATVSGQLRPCLIEGGSTGEYECIDTSSELESCGGCMVGEAGTSITSHSKRGSNCLSAPGVAWDSVTCNRGVCTAYACNDGFALVDGTCDAISE